MASIRWSLLLFLAQLHIILSTSSAHDDADNLTRLSVPFLCHPDQADALLQLKKSFYFDRSTTRLQSWRHGTDCCVWEGVGCDASSGNVTVLNLNNRGLSSYGLNPAIFNLTSLRRLDLSMNDFCRNRDYATSIMVLVDNIPAAGFESFALLTHLNLSNSGFVGQIPSGISKLVNLLSLDISSSIDYSFYYEQYNNYYENYGWNNLYEQNFGALVGNLSSLRELLLDGVDLSGNEDWCISLATSVPNLEVLSLASCGMSGPIHKSLSRLYSLTVINLQFNSWTAGQFPEFFMDFLNLTVLQLSDTNLKGWFPSRSFQSKNLRVLDLSSNWNLSGYIPNFSNVSSLETLRLDGTNLSSAKPTFYNNFKLLKELSIDGNLVSVDFLSSLGRLGSLWQLHLGFGSESELISIFTWIGDLHNLTSLDLHGCNFSMATPSSVSSFKALRRLTMFDCNLPGSIISAIGNLMHLQTLKIGFCTTYGSIPSSFGNLTNLMSIYIDGTDFSGPLPDAIGNLTSLTNIYISHSGFSGSFPPAVGNLINLKTMVIYGTFISGTVPYTIGQLNKLGWLVLTECNLSGRIPSSIGNLTQLTKLDLSYNNFSGEIPSSIFTIHVLRVLDLSSNQLSGPIREFDKALTQLESVDLSENELSGQVDLAWFWRLTNINTLQLSYNKLSVMDSESNIPLPSDQFGPYALGLASCNITEFPRSLMRSNYIKYLDLSCNKISGDIPNWLWENCSSLAYLNLSHNLLTGMQLTSDVLPLTSLGSLDLSFNKFQGQIPMPKSSPKFMDYSNNNFSSVLPNFTLYLWETSYLSMSKNIIYGQIPYSICNSTLEILDLSYNNFNGPLPSCLIENGQSLVLNLKGNQFEGMLPSNITTRCLLQTIDFHGNKIYGKLPRGLSNCLQLEVLDLGSNRLVDTFPSWLRGLPKLSVFGLRSNQFYGSIGDIVGDSKFKEYFPSLQIIDLAANNFSGNLRPQWFEQLKSMMNNFNSTGQIIAVNNASSHTEITYKGFDMIFERILTTLTEIDLSNNRLEGTIPESIGRLVALRALNLSHNSFTGEIPAQLGGMTDLESLDLSCNKLSGKIPQELTNLTFLDVLNLSSNHLEGKVPQSRQFSTFGSNSFEGNAGLCGPPVSELPCGASPYTPGVTYVHKSSHHVDVMLFLFVGLGFGVGFAAAILVKWGRVRQMVYCNCKGFANLIAARR